MTDNEKLAACPFCGCTDIKTERDGPEFPPFIVWCLRCGASIDADTDCIDRGEVSPFDRWNQRTPQAGDELAREFAEQINTDQSDADLGKWLNANWRRILTTLTPTEADHERMLNDLLCVIHRDGGQRIEEVGQEQAWMEAMMTVPFLLQQSEELAALSSTGTDTAQSEAEQVREAAAKVAETFEPRTAETSDEFLAACEAVIDVATAIRAMPLPTTITKPDAARTADATAEGEPVSGAVLPTTDKERVLREQTYAEWQQWRGMLASKVDWAIAEYDGFMLDDAYDAQRVLDHIIDGLRTTRAALSTPTGDEA